MWQLVEAIEGISEACRALDTPITGGNVSLYNETDGKAIYPTPVIGIVGVIDDASCVLGRSFRGPGGCDRSARRGAGGARRQRVSQDGPQVPVAGSPPALDLARERALITLLSQLSSRRMIRSAHDCSDGGLAVALAECTFDSGGLGASVDIADGSARDDAAVFGESASRVIVSATEQNAATLLRLAAEHGVPAQVIGRTGGTRITLRVSGRPVIDCDLEAAYTTWATAFERHFAGRAA